MNALRRVGGYEFREPELAIRALTPAGARLVDNERFEFLGDRLLDAAVTVHLIRIAPKASEGGLSILRASCVNDAMLTLVGRALGLDELLQDDRPATDARIGDAVEALSAAVYFDRGFEVLCQCVEFWFQARFREISANLGRLDTYIESLRNPKGRLQEFAAKRRLPAPVYKTQRQRQGGFTCVCTLGQRRQAGTGRGGSRARAEREAAGSLLAQLQGEGAAEIHAHMA